MKKFILALFSIVMVTYVAACAGLYLMQDNLLYHPKPRGFTAPQGTLILPVENEKIVVSIKQHTGPKAIIYFGGNGEDVSRNIPVFDKTFPDHALYLMHYRGYGGSTGRPSEEANFMDAVALFKTIQKNHGDIAIIGRSLGSGIATRLASQFPATKLVLITPYDSIEGIASNKYPFIPIRFLLRDKYNSGKYALNIKTLTTIFMAENDQVVPRQSTELLFSRFQKDVASLVLVEGTGHNTISNSIHYLPSLQRALGVTSEVAH